MLRMDKVLDFSKVGDAIEPPDLIQIQTAGYERFLQADLAPDKRKHEGLEALLREVFPIISYDRNNQLEYVSYELGEPRYTTEECRQLRLTYGRPLRIRCRLVRKDKKDVVEEAIYLGDMPTMIGGGEFIVNGAERVIVSQLHRSPGVDFTIEFQESDRPLHGARIIPERGSWIEMSVTKRDSLNVRIDQSSKFPVTAFLRAMDEAYGTTEALIHEFYETEKVEPDAVKPQMFAVSAIVDPESGEELVPAGGQIGDAVTRIQATAKKKVEVVSKAPDLLILNTLMEDPADSYESALLRIYARLRPGNPPQMDKAKTLFKEKFYDENRYRLGKVGRFRLNRKFGPGRSPITTLEDFFKRVEIAWVKVDHFKDPGGEDQEGLSEFLNLLEGRLMLSHPDREGIPGSKHYLPYFNVDDPKIGAGRGRKVSPEDFKETWKKTSAENRQLLDNFIEIRFAKEWHSASECRNAPKTPGVYVFRLDERVVYVGQAGYRKGEGLRERLYECHVMNNQDSSFHDHLKDFFGKGCVLRGEYAEMTLRASDMVNAIKYILRLRGGEGVVDDIDHLGNRRLRTIDELASDELRKGFLKLRRTVQERMSLREPEELNKISELINSKSVSSSIEFFFGRSELSQVVDQTNPLSQLTHERRLSALGPGGLNRKRAGFEVRDVHISHYGRICPVETPEGNNIGLISSLSLYATVDEYGFLTTPYRKVSKGRVSDEVQWLRADEESQGVLAPPDVMETDQTGRARPKLPDRPVLARVKGEVSQIDSGEVAYLDVSPKQTVGVSAALIPFLEHDDANRALMGSNMQRQAVPLIRTEPAIVATGLERIVAQNSGMVVRARNGGTVTFVDALGIVIDNVDEYELRKFARLNERTCLNQKPVVRVGQRVKQGEIIADGPGCCQGELALGRNILVAFVPFDGFNFEDAILLSERLVKTDAFTSVHIEEYEVEIRETKLGREEFTRDIPNVSEKSLRNLDENGVVRVGTPVKAGDVLVGKVAPKSKSELTPEEKLLHAIFGRAGEEVKNDSLELPAGEEGVVIAARRFSRRVQMSDEQNKALSKQMKEYGARMDLKAINAFRTMCAEINEVLGEPMVDPSTRQKVGQSEIDAVLLEQIENFSPRWIRGGKKVAPLPGPFRGSKLPDYFDLFLKGEKDANEWNGRTPAGLREKLEKVSREILNRGYITKDELLLVNDYKVFNDNRFRQGNHDEVAALSEEDIENWSRHGIEVLKEIGHNVQGVVGAYEALLVESRLPWVNYGKVSTFLRFLVPEVASIIDWQVWNALAGKFDGVKGQKKEAPKFSPDDYTAYLKALARIAKVQPRRMLPWQVDAAIWEAVSGTKANWEIKEEWLLGDIDDSSEAKDVAKERADNIFARYWPLIEEIRREKARKLGHMKRGDELPSGVLEMVKVYVATKRRLSVGDKMAGRHGNKGVIARILPEEDMPFLADGTTVDMCLNPLGVPSRMNVGQILETHLGWAAAVLGFKAVTPVFDGAREPEIVREIERANEHVRKRRAELTVVQEAGSTRELLAEMPTDGKTVLYDGRTGQAFEQKVTVGYMYLNKLHHLVDEKIHARSTGPYSLITQQPLGGKARTGGQRFGEMEVWALESYGASYTLQEMLTVKSDDVEGRTKIYESMVKGNNSLEAGTPVSFDVLCNELRGLGLNIQLEKKGLI